MMPTMGEADVEMWKADTRLAGEGRANGECDFM